MRAKTANMAGQIPVFTANMVRRCKMCAVLVGQHLDMLSWQHDTWILGAYLANPVVVRFRRSKNVTAIAIRTSTTAPRTRHEVAIPCPANAEVIGSEHRRRYLL